MENDINKERWVNEALHSLEGISRAQPRDGLYERIISKLNGRQAVKVIRLYPKQWAVAVILLLSLNIGSVVYFARQHNKTELTAAANPLAMEIQSGTTYNY